MILNRLRENGIVRRIGSDRDGYREIVEKNETESSLKSINKNGTVNGTKNVLENALETSASLAEYFKVSERTIRRDLQFLQKNGLISRIGPAKGGHWEVIENE